MDIHTSHSIAHYTSPSPPAANCVEQSFRNVECWKFIRDFM